MSEAKQSTVPGWTLGWRLQRALGFADIPVGAMAGELGVNRGTMSRWLNDRGPVRDIYLRQWATRCGVPYEWLRDGDEGGSADSARATDEPREDSERRKHSTCSAPSAIFEPVAA